MEPRRDDLKNYIEETLIFSFGQDVDDSSNLFEAGLLDSFGYISIIKFAEDHYKIKFKDEDLVSPEMVSLNGIYSIIEKRLSHSE